MIAHFGIKGKDLEASKFFYQAALAPLNYCLQFDNEWVASFSEPKNADPTGDFWLNIGQQELEHFVFSAQNPQEIDNFYQAALAAGGKDNGAPGERSHYHPGYYAA
ncbi:putative glyoxalase [Streptococcus milleri]|uniref:VOC family protein n=1 Tax=Streptococcus milleri TaxID=33040 RepID=UPI000F6E5EF6|nr:VOC family protein [Streptococcus milleri]VEE81823.1 putative glyoxalase [Streptococcus milleri]